MSTVRSFRPALLAALAAAAVVSGCATPPSDPQQRQAFIQESDPLEVPNRFIFAFNELIDFMVLRAASESYHQLVPDVAQDSVHNFLRNIRTPAIVLDRAFQGNWKEAGDAGNRFLINTTLGVGGLIDTADSFGYPFKDYDFGRTLAGWGVDDGPYVVLPLAGPSTARDAVGYGIDSAANPVSVAVLAGAPNATSLSYNGLAGIDARSRLLKPIDDLRRNSLDYYAAVRSAYRQRRDAEVNGGSTADIPDYSGPGK